MTAPKRISHADCETLMDYLMDGEATIEEARIELPWCSGYIRRLATYCQALGLVDSRVCQVGARREVRWFMVRTRKVAA